MFRDSLFALSLGKIPYHRWKLNAEINHASEVLRCN